MRVHKFETGFRSYVVLHHSDSHRLISLIHSNFIVVTGGHMYYCGELN